MERNHEDSARAGETLMAGGSIVHSTQSSSLADILERVLDKGIVVAGDISISLVGVELLTIKIRLVIASVDKAKEIGIDWWNQPLAIPASTGPASTGPSSAGTSELAEIARRLERLEARLAIPHSEGKIP